MNVIQRKTFKSYGENTTFFCAGTVGASAVHAHRYLSCVGVAKPTKIFDSLID